MPGARVTAENEANGRKFDAVSDANGRYELLPLPAGSYRLFCEAQEYREKSTNGVEVEPGRATNLDIDLSSKEELQYDCGCSMKDATLEKLLRSSAPYTPEAVVHLSLTNSGAIAGSEIWLTVALTNISDHVLVIPTDKSSGHTFAYHVSIWDPCNCPAGGDDVGMDKTTGEVSSDKEKKDIAAPNMTSTIRLAPGASLTDKVEISKMISLIGNRSYRIRVSRLYNFGGIVERSDSGLLWIISNRVSVTVKPAMDSVVRSK